MIMRWKRMFTIPCLLSAVYIPVAMGIFHLFREWAQWPLNIITFPASILFQWLDNACAAKILHYQNRLPITPHEYAMANALELCIYVIGGALWFFCLGMAYVFLFKNYNKDDAKAK